MAEEAVRSPLRWAGSKRKLIPTLEALAPRDYNRYIEPFCGSLCLFVALKPKLALVGDINEELVHFYKMVAWRPNVISRIAHEYPNDAETYYNLRGLNPFLLGAEERAARFFYLNRFCFNGVYRTNRLGVFNVPRGHHTGAIPSGQELLGFGRLIRRAQIVHSDFESLVEEAGSDDFVYLDPPYAGRDVRDRGEYGLGAFKLPDLDRLEAAIVAASQRGAKILLSYADLPEMHSRFRDWQITSLDVVRNVAGFAGSRRSASELILRNYR